jgi:sulfite reductase (NADPH) flavoprotein alpha-component
MSALPAGVLPLDSEQNSKLQSAVSGLSPQQLQWVSGYAAGLAAAGSSPAVSLGNTASIPAAHAASDERLTVLYGSQTGNGEEIATALAHQATVRGFSATAVSLADYKPAHLKRESLVTFVISTHGEGDPPDDAEIFHEFLLSQKAPRLDKLKYSVLALGDSSYVNFCQTGREFDSRLAALGAKRIAATVECDLDYEAASAEWSDQILDSLPDLLGTDPVSTAPVLRAVDAVSTYSKSNPFPAEVLTNQKITGGSSSKDVRHIELSLEGSGLSYEPGDALAVVVNNPPQLVSELLSVLQLDGDTTVTVKDDDINLADALSRRLEITAVNLGFLRAWSAIANNSELSALLDDEDQSRLTSFVDNYQIIDVVREYPAEVDASDLVAMLRPMSPRSYSIASSQQANPDEVHLTVAAVRYKAFGSEHWGAASTHLADRLNEGDTVSVFVERNKRFRLPADDLPVVMIGPGTGIAPFRAFVEERAERGASGSNWLFFGDRNFDSDFLYQLEWQRHLKQGNLQRLDVAFSRDQRQKIYVQDRIREQGAELHRWIEQGAAIYVCGDAKNMASDVEDALLDVITTHGGKDRAAATRILKDLRAAGRYQRDVY